MAIATTAEITEALNLRTGQKIWMFTIWTDRKESARGGLTKGKKAGSLVGDSVPQLLRSVASLVEQEGSLEAVADRIKKARLPQQRVI